MVLRKIPRLVIIKSQTIRRGCIMKDFVEYIENSCAGIADTPALYRFKRKLLDEITERANEVTASGLSDDNVVYDLIKDEHPDLKAEYARFAEEYRRKKRASLMRKVIAAGTVLFLVVMFLLYFALSFATGRWGVTWLIIVGGVFAVVIFLLSFLIKRLCRMKRIFHPIARILVAGSIMLVTVFAFLTALVAFDMELAWTIIPAGIIVMFISDGIFARITRQKFRIINYFIYIPAAAAMLYVILGAHLVVSWNRGWLLVILGVAVDIAIMLGIAINNSRYIYKQEDDDEWNDD